MSLGQKTRILISTDSPIKGFPSHEGVFVVGEKWPAMKGSKDISYRFRSKCMKAMPMRLGKTWWTDKCDTDSFSFYDSSISENIPDVFYFVSTNVVTAKDEAGNVSMRSQLTSEDKEYMDMELRFVKDSIFGSEFNFVAPYYHQYTFESCTTNPWGFDSVRVEVGKEACEAFDFYMKNINHGRRYILAGFSQGGEMVMDILRHMNEEQYSRMVAAYVIGYKVTASDTANYATIRPAQGETDTGVTVSFNSVLKEDGIWDFVAGGTSTCINPVNWRTDDMPATLTFQGKPKVRVDKKHHVLIVDTAPGYYRKWMRETPPYSTSGISDNCLHHWDLLFYTRQIHENAIKRSRR